MLIEVEQITKFSGYDQTYVLEIYLELNGDKSKLRDLFLHTTDFNSSLFIDLAKNLMLEYCGEVSDSLLKLLYQDDISAERKIQSAYYLVELGNEIGFSFLIEIIQHDSPFPENMLRAPSFDSINTKFVVNKLDKIIHHILDRNAPHTQNQMHTPSVKEFVLNCLNLLARKGEDDMLLVEIFLNNFYIEAEGKYPNAKEILFHIDRIVESCRELDNHSYQVNDVKQILEKIE